MWEGVPQCGRLFPSVGGCAPKHSDGIFCSAVTVICTSLFTAVLETPLSMPLIGEGRNVTNI